MARPMPGPTSVVPLMVNTIQFPLPQPGRCYKLGQAIRKAVDAYPKDLRVLILGTGGMSHQLQGERSGHMRPAFDRMFLKSLIDDPLSLTNISLGEYMKEAGHEGGRIDHVASGTRRRLTRLPERVYQHYHVSASLSAAGLGCYVDA